MTGPLTADFYVATNGNDAWSGQRAVPAPGESDGPFRTLERARAAVRRLRATADASSITVMIRGGVYERDQPFSLSAEDSGSLGAPVIWCACPGETVILSGGVSLPSNAFVPVTDEQVLARLEPAARDQVLQADLHARGIAELGSFPVKFQGAPAVPELFFDHRRMTLARWPDDDWTTIATITEPGSCPRTGDTGNVGGVFTYVGDRPTRWQLGDGVWLHGYWCYDWHAEVIQVRSIDHDRREITLAAPALYSVRQGNPSPRRFYALNLLDELTRPGEYYLDRNAGRLYFWPPAPLASAPVVLSLLAAPVVAIEDASHVVVRGLTIEASLADGIEVNGGTGVCLEACEVRNTRELGIKIGGGSNHRIEACDIHDTGTGGIVLSGGDRKTLTPARHEVVNNHIHGFSRLRMTNAHAISIQGVGNRAAHNLIHDAPHQAVRVSGNEHCFEYNIVHDVCTATDDCGAYYKGRDPSCRGNLVRYNFFHHIGSPMGHGSAAIYFDDGDGGDTVFGNVFYRCGDPGKGTFGAIHSHGGHDNRVTNNVFIECRRALGSAPWDDARWSQAIAGGLECFWQEKLLRDVDITKPPYTTRYPELIGFMTPRPGQARHNHATGNVFVRCGEISVGNWQVPSSGNWVTDADPGFVNAAAGDFAFASGAEVFAVLPDFEPIPFDRIGLLQNRAAPGSA